MDPLLDWDMDNALLANMFGVPLENEDLEEIAQVDMKLKDLMKSRIEFVF